MEIIYLILGFIITNTKHERVDKSMFF